MGPSDSERYLNTVTYNLTAMFPEAEQDNDIPLYRSVSEGMRNESYEMLHAHLRAQRSVLRIFSSTALNATAHPPGTDTIDDAWRAYRARLQDTLGALRALLSTLETPSGSSTADDA